MSIGKSQAHQRPLDGTMYTMLIGLPDNIK